MADCAQHPIVGLPAEKAVIASSLLGKLLRYPILGRVQLLFMTVRQQIGDLCA